MNARDALGRLHALRVPAATTADTAAVLGISTEAASHTLRRLAQAGLVTPVRKGLWALTDEPDPLALAEYVTAPYPSYVSLQTALYRHGMGPARAAGVRPPVSGWCGVYPAAPAP